MRHKHNFKDVIWYIPVYDYGYWLYVYRAKYCSCGKIKEKRLIYDMNFSFSETRENKIDWWEKQGAITEEEFALKYR